MTYLRFSFFLLSAVAAIELAACGEQGVRPRTPQEGFLLGGPIEGLSYETPTESGVTDAEGRFIFRSGERVRFFMGATVIGETEARAQLTLFDLVPGGAPLRGNDAIRAAQDDREHPIHAIANIALLLYTLDVDGNAENGQRISPEIASLFEDVRMNFTKPVASFRRDPRFRGILRRANDDGLLQGISRGVPKASSVMQAVYDNLGIDPAISLLVRSERRDRGGTLEGTYAALYDDGERLVERIVDLDGDGVADTTELVTYDSHGTLTKWETEHAREGLNDNAWCFTYRYDGDGNITYEESFADGCASPATGSVTRTYDENGQLLSEDASWGGDPSTRRVRSYRYDAHGNLLRRESDNDLDGDADFVETHAYDDHDRVLHHFGDYDADGAPEYEAFFEWDSEGRPLRYESRQPIREPHIETWTYDERGNLLRYESDWVGSQEGPYAETQAFDAEGNRTRFEKDEDGDGVAERVERWGYDGRGDEIRYELDLVGDGQPELIIESWHDGAGNRTRAETDNGGDGVVDSVQHWTYDARGNLTRHEWDFLFEGPQDSIETWQYDENGNLVRNERAGWLRTWTYNAEGRLMESYQASPEGIVVMFYEPGTWLHFDFDPPENNLIIYPS